MASSRSVDIDITVVSAKHLKNINWKHGELKPYAVFWVDPEIRHTTQPDESGSTRPVWNERFTFSVNRPLHDSVLDLEVFHSKPSETPKPLVGSLRIPLKNLVDADNSGRIKTFQLLRPSGRPEGKIRLKLAVREQLSAPAADLHLDPRPPVTYFSSAPSPTPAHDPRGYSHSYTYPPPHRVSQSSSPHPYAAYSDPYAGYYGYYPWPPPPPPPPPRQYFDWSANYGGPSAPVDHSYDQTQMGVRNEEAKIKDRADSEFYARYCYGDHRSDY